MLTLWANLTIARIITEQSIDAGTIDVEARWVEEPKQLEGPAP